MQCLICKDEMQLPHYLPCDHRFCYICIKRHILKRPFCPSCLLEPIHTTEIKPLFEYPKNDLETVRKVLYRTPTNAALKKELKKLSLDTSGSINQMLWRYNEFHIIYSGEVQKIRPKSITDITRTVHMNEKLIFMKRKKNNDEIKNLLKTFRNDIYRNNT